MTVSVELCIRGNFDPHDITERIGIIPCKSALKGSRNHSLGLPVFSGWTISSRTVQMNMDSVNEIMNELLLKISPKVEILKSVLIDFKADVGIVFLIRSHSSNEIVSWGFEISLDLLNFSSEIAATIEIAVCNIIE